jgi:hypothetical protein
LKESPTALKKALNSPQKPMEVLDFEEIMLTSLILDVKERKVSSRLFILELGLNVIVHKPFRLNKYIQKGTIIPLPSKKT